MLRAIVIPSLLYTVIIPFFIPIVNNEIGVKLTIGEKISTFRANVK